MTDRATLLALAERVEAATGADSECVIREASWAVNVMLANRQDLHNRVNVLLSVEAYESAAMSLVPSGYEWSVNWCGNSVANVSEIGVDYPVHCGGAATPALALTAASLRAIAGSLPND